MSFCGFCVRPSIPPLRFYPPFTSHFHCIQHLTDRQQCRGSQNADKSLFFFSIYKKRAYHWAPSLYPVLSTSFHILPAWPLLARYLFLLFISQTDPSVYFPSQRDRPEPVCAGNPISIRLITVKSPLQNSSFFSDRFKNICYCLYSLISTGVMSSASLLHTGETACRIVAGTLASKLL